MQKSPNIPDTADTTDTSDTRVLRMLKVVWKSSYMIDTAYTIDTVDTADTGLLYLLYLLLQHLFLYQGLPLLLLQMTKDDKKECSSLIIYLDIINPYFSFVSLCYQQ